MKVWDPFGRGLSASHLPTLKCLIPSPRAPTSPQVYRGMAAIDARSTYCELKLYTSTVICTRLHSAAKRL